MTTHGEAPQTEVVGIATLKPHPRNYRVHPPVQLEHIAASLRQHGFYRNVVVARDGTILAGHGIVEAALSIGLSSVPVFRLPIEADSPAALKVLTGDNELTKLAEVDDRALSDLLKEIQDTSADGLVGTGFDAEMLAGLVMVTRPMHEVADIDAAREWVGLPAYENGADPDAGIRLLITFKDEESRAAFTKTNALFVTVMRKGRLYCAHWPSEPQSDWSSIRFTEAPTPEDASGNVT